MEIDTLSWFSFVVAVVHLSCGPDNGRDAAEELLLDNIILPNQESSSVVDVLNEIVHT